MGIDRRAFVRSSVAAAASALPATRLWADAMSSGAIPASLAAVTGTGKSISLAAADIRDLRSALHGALLLAQDAGYDSARRLWNPAFDRHPALIARCASPRDVARAVMFAQAHGLLTAVRGGGHSLSGQSACDGGIMIDVQPMQDVQVDAQRRLVTAQGGALLGEVDRKTQAVGLATTMGTATETGIAGLTLGGGIGRLMRRYGLACDNLEFVEIVTADGRLQRASATENPDLFWAVRGGGGNFGIVTAFQYRLHPLKDKVMDGTRVYPWDKARDLLQVVADLGEKASDDTLLAVVLNNAAPKPSEPHPGRVAVLSLTHLGSAADCEKLLAPLKTLGPPLADDIGAKDYLLAQGATGSAPVAIPVGTNIYVKTGFMQESPPAMLDDLVHRFEAAPSSIDMQVLWALMGGAVARVAPEATAFWNRRVTHDLMITGTWSDRKQDEANIRTIRTLWTAVEKFTTGFYVNSEPGAADARIRATYGGNFGRLVALKNRYDPGNLFRLNANIRPAAG